MSESSRDKAVGGSHAGTDRNQGRAFNPTKTESYCPVCENRQSGFMDFNGRKKVRCSRCGSLERHRSVWMYFKEHTDLFEKTERKFLHFAPESCFADKFSSFFRSGYLTSDLNMASVMTKMDVMNIQYPAASFEIIYSSHVLEHVENYVQALQEFFRVLVPSGWMILLIPERTEEKTFRFPQKSPSGHIWKFGRDFIKLLEEIGFKVRLRTVAKLFSPSQIRSMRLKKRQEIFHCFK